jgi:hypothetical protein
MMRKVILLTLTGLMAMLLWVNSPALAEEEAVTEEAPHAQLGEDATPMNKSFEEETVTAEPPSATLGEEVTPMDKSFQEKPKHRYPEPLPRVKEQLKDTQPFFRDTKLDLNLRTYYASSDNYDDTRNEAWALGGSLAYRSGWFLDRLKMGAALYTSQPLYAPDGRDGTLLLKPGQEGYTVVGQLYGKVKLREQTIINIYRQEANSPYLNGNDSRMSPNTFEGYTFAGAAGGKEGAPKINYGAGYIDKIKPRNSDRFISMSKAAGAEVNRGVAGGGANIAFPAFSIGAVDYYSEDIINIGYAEAKYAASLSERAGLVLSAQFTDQRSVGEDLLKGYSFKTNQVGVKADMSYGESIFTLAYTSDSPAADLQNPWSSYPGYTNVQVQSFNRAGEEALMVRGAYDFSQLGLKDLAAYALWVHGWGAVDPVTRNAVYQQDEYDVDLQWLPKSGDLKGMWFRIRYGHADQRGVSNASANDFRVIVNYDLSLL